MDFADTAAAGRIGNFAFVAENGGFLIQKGTDYEIGTVLDVQGRRGCIGDGAGP